MSYQTCFSFDARVPASSPASYEWMTRDPVVTRVSSAVIPEQMNSRCIVSS